MNRSEAHWLFNVLFKIKTLHLFWRFNNKEKRDYWESFCMGKEL